MSEGAVGLPIRDGLRLPAELRAVLRPGETMRDREGRARRLPRFFYEVDAWETARATALTPHFKLWEFMDTDLHEAGVLQRWPRYVPCAVTLLAAQLELLRDEVGVPVHIAANGGYRSPGHDLSTHATPHCWGTAVNVFRIGETLLAGESEIRRYNDLVRRVLPTVWVRPYGTGVGEVMDHVHLDLGYVTLVPRDAPSEESEEDTSADAGAEHTDE